MVILQLNHMAGGLLDLGMGWLACCLQYVQMASEGMLGAGGGSFFVFLGLTLSLYGAELLCLVLEQWTGSLPRNWERQVYWCKSKW